MPATCRTATLSPVSADSSARKLWASITRASAGTFCPCASTRMSPGTISAASTWCRDAIAQDHGFEDQQLIQRIQLLLRPELLEETEQHADGDDTQDEESGQSPVSLTRQEADCVGQAAANSNTNTKKLANCLRNRRSGEIGLRRAISLRPNRSSLVSASAV